MLGRRSLKIRGGKARKKEEERGPEIEREQEGGREGKRESEIGRGRKSGWARAQRGDERTVKQESSSRRQ
jgi:hypothetical protein